MEPTSSNTQAEGTSTCEEDATPSAIDVDEVKRKIDKAAICAIGGHEQVGLDYGDIEVPSRPFVLAQRWCLESHSRVKSKNQGRAPKRKDADSELAGGSNKNERDSDAKLLGKCRNVVDVGRIISDERREDLKGRDGIRQHFRADVRALRARSTLEDTFYYAGCSSGGAKRKAGSLYRYDPNFHDCNAVARKHKAVTKTKKIESATGGNNPDVHNRIRAIEKLELISRNSCNAVVNRVESVLINKDFKNPPYAGGPSHAESVFRDHYALTRKTENACKCDASLELCVNTTAKTENRPKNVCGVKETTRTVDHASRNCLHRRNLAQKQKIRRRLCENIEKNSWNAMTFLKSQKTEFRLREKRRQTQPKRSKRAIVLKGKVPSMPASRNDAFAAIANKTVHSSSEPTLKPHLSPGIPYLISKRSGGIQEHHSTRKFSHLFSKKDHTTSEIPLHRAGAAVEVRRSHEAVEFDVPDGGYGWICLACAFIIIFLVSGIYTTSGVVYLDVMETFPETKHAVAAFIFSLSFALTLALAILASMLSRKFTTRWVTIISGVGTSLSLMAIFFTMNVPYLIICYIFAGVFGAGTSMPSVLVLSLHFRRHRSLATGLALSGAAFSGLIQPPIVERLCQIYNFQGAMFVMGAFTLNSVPCAMLLRNPWDPTIRRTVKAKESEGDDELPPMIPIIQDSAFSDVSEDFDEETSVITLRSLPSQLVSTTNSTPYTPCPHGYRRISPKLQARLHDHILHYFTFRRPSALRLIGMEIATRKRVHHPYSLNAADIAYTSQEQQQHLHHFGHLHGKPPLSVKTFSNPVFIIVFLASVCSAGSYPHLVMFLPSFAFYSRLCDELEAAALVSICFLGDIAGRAVLSSTFNRSYALLQYGLLIAIASVYFILCVLPLHYAHYWYISACMFIYGLAGGPAILLMPILLADDRHPNANLREPYIAIRLGQAVACAAVPPLGGIIVDVKEDGFKFCVLLMSALAFLSAFTLVFLSPAKRRFRPPEANMSAVCTDRMHGIPLQPADLSRAMWGNSPAFSVSRRNIASRAVSSNRMTEVVVAKPVSKQQSLETS